MKEKQYKQIYCISEHDAASFEERANDVLAQTPEPEIFIDQSRPFTMYIVYSVSKNIPESALELLEMLDPDGGRANCCDCRYFEPSNDHRKKWGACRKKGQGTRCDSRACEVYYLERRQNAAKLAEQYNNLPFK